MHFQVHKRIRDVSILTEPRAEVTDFGWSLQTKERVLCHSAQHWPTEVAARSNIAQFKTSVKGARFAKVKSPGDMPANKNDLLGETENGDSGL